MISRIRIEAYAPSAAEVEATLKAAYALIVQTLEPGSRVSGSIEAEPDDEMVIERDLVEPFGSITAFKGRMRLLLNVANDGGQVGVLRSHGVDVTTHYWSGEEAERVGGVTTV